LKTAPSNNFFESRAVKIGACVSMSGDHPTSAAYAGQKNFVMAASVSKRSGILTLRLRGKIVLLFAITTLALFAAAAVGFYKFNVSVQAFAKANLAQNNAIDVEATESDFKKQVQEWKDTLLRGKQPDSLNKYWGNFQKRENDVLSEAERLGQNIPDPEAADLVRQFVVAHKSMGEAYRRGLEAFKSHGFDSAAGDAAVAGIDRPPTELLTKAKDQLVTEAAARARAAQEIASRAISTSVMLFIAVTAAGVIIFLIAVQSSISRPLRRLNGAMHELASGKFDVVLPGLGRGDEIGDIAGAVEEFKVKAAEKAQRDAEEKIEQDKKLAAERETAARRMADEFQAAVGGLVKAAVAGDFSQRVNLNGKSGLVLNVGTALNSLCENVSKALDDLIGMLNALAGGDLSKRIAAQYHGNFALLKDNANTTAEQIGSTIADLTSVARDVTTASVEISTSTTDLSQRTEEQAASLEETSASMEQMSATVKKNADNAQQASKFAGETRQVAEHGGAVVGDAVEAMARIEQSSHKISDIIGVIDEIARQTNLLALNAAVEAARAGDAGRGFAVVASEVRTLAQRSSQAAKDIKDLITSSANQVKDGVDLVNRTGSSLTDIVTSIKKVADIVADIAVASSEQANGLEQLNKALANMDVITQKNSALVEENAATAKNLEMLAGTMDARLGAFVLDRTGQTQASPPAAKREPGNRSPSPPRSSLNAAEPAKRAPARAPKAVGATALKQEPDWKEF
jgi:methyl-accepting chemotaxis protein